MILGMLRQPIKPLEAKPVPVVSCEYWQGVGERRSQNEAEASWVRRIIFCESTCNSKADNPYSYAYGIVQFMPQTFSYECVGDFENPYHQIDCALKMYRQGKSGQWSCK